jgi:SAM-dependent methyltransferase
VSAETATDGAAFYQGSNLHVTFYDMLYGKNAGRFGDLAWYNTLAEHLGSTILDGGCGSGRVMQALVRAGRDIVAFDASTELLQQANVKARAVASPQCSILLSRQRMETFKFAKAFNLMVFGYYGFSNLLEPEQRIGCLKQIAAHLAPRGLAVLHLPAAEQLCSEVPQAEIDKMHLQHKVATGIGPDLLLAQFVSAIQYDPLLKLNRPVFSRHFVAS